MNANTERRTGTRQMIDSLLAERQEMLIQFCRVAGLEPYTPDKPVVDLLQDFCQVLMDYTAFGHFEVYRRISDGFERREKVKDAAKVTYPRIAETTELAVAFNDRYDNSTHELKLEKLPTDLSTLGEEMAVRIELEDKLIEAMLVR